jgi:hypothetical protein
MLFASTPGGLLAQEVPTGGPRSLQQLVADLGSEDFDVRVDATESLSSERSPYRLRDLEAILRSPQLSPEQRSRLMQAALARFAGEPRAAMGISAPQVDEAHSIVIQSVTPDYPAAALLKPGDRIESLDGVRLDGFDSFRAIVIAHDPGDEIAIQIVRQGQSMTLRVRLGLYGAAPNFMPIGQFIPAAWKYRSREYRGLEIGEPVLNVRFAQDGWRWPQDDSSSALARVGGGDPLPIAMGGESQEANDPVHAWRRGQNENPNDAIFNQRALRLPGGVQNGVREQVMVLQQSITLLRMQLQDLQLQRANPKASPVQQAQWDQMADMIKTQIMQEQEEVKRLLRSARVTPNQPEIVLPNR